MQNYRTAVRACTGAILIILALVVGCTSQRRTQEPQQSRTTDQPHITDETAAKPTPHPADGSLDQLAPPPQADMGSTQPGPENSALPTPRPAPVAKTPVTSGGAQTYVVQSGDTLTKIAKQFYGEGSKKNVDRIMKANKGTLSKPSQLKPGMKLTIPQ